MVGLEALICPKTYANFVEALLPDKLRQLYHRAVLKSNALGCDDGQRLYGLDLSPLEVYGDYCEGATPMRPKDGQPTSEQGLMIASRVITDVPNCPLEATLILLAQAPKRPSPQPPLPQTHQEKLWAIPGTHLKVFLRLEGLKVSGTKRVLVERILQEAHPGKGDVIISLFFTPPQKKVVEDQQIPGDLSGLRVEAAQLQATILTHRTRWDIENRFFRVCKEGCFLEYLPVSTWEATQNHLFLLALTCNLWTLFKKRMDETLEKASPQRLRQEFFPSFQFFIKDGAHTGLVGMEALMELY